MKINLLQLAILLAGVGQLAVAATSVLIPFLLGWREETARLKPLTRQVFWTYASYILGTHICFALVSIAGAAWLTDGSALAACVTAYMAVHWLTRLSLQLFWYERSIASTRTLFRVAEALYVTAFVSFGAIYAAAAVHNVAKVLG